MAVTKWSIGARSSSAAILLALGLTACPTTQPAPDSGQADAGNGDSGNGPGIDGGHDGGPAGAGHTFATAATIPLDSATNTHGTLVDVTTTKDYYTFQGTAGDRLVIVTNAQSLAAAGTDQATIADTVVTLYDASMTQIAQNDDGWPRESTDSELFVILPATGTYYVTVGGCQSAFTTGCGDAAAVTMRNYEVFVAHTNMLVAAEVNATATNATSATAAHVAYAVPMGGMTGAYGTVNLDGTFATAGATQVFAFTPPADTMVDATQRAHAEFWVQGNTTAGDGSTAGTHIWVTGADGTTIVAEETSSNYSTGGSAGDPPHLSVPVTLGQQYYLFVQSTATTSAPTTDYYFITHFVGTFYYGTAERETTAGSNDTIATATALATPAMAGAGTYFVDGDLATATDEDWFNITLPAGTTQFELSCEGQRVGSGLVGLTASLATMDGTVLTGSTITETALDAAATAAPVTIPAGTTHLFVHVHAASQSATNTGSYYSCDGDIP